MLTINNAYSSEAIQRERAYLLTYSKRQTIPDTAHGNLFHIYRSIYTAFFYALQENLSFEMHLEDQNYGDFDDMILITQNTIIATQYKHHLEPSEQSFNSFITGNKKDGDKLALPVYFDSLYEKLDNATEYVFCSNNTLPREIEECLDNNHEKFSDSFYQESNPRLKYLKNLIYASIFKFSENLNPHFTKVSEEFSTETSRNPNSIFQHTSQFITDMHESGCLIFKTAYIGKLNVYISDFKQTKAEKNKAHYKNSVLLFDMLLTNFAFAKYPEIQDFISKFIKKIKFEFNSMSFENIQEDIKNKIKDRFSTTNDIFYHAFFQEFYSNLISKKAIKVTNEDIKLMVEEWYNKYIILERLYAYTKYNLDYTNTSIGEKTLDRKPLLKRLTEKLSSYSTTYPLTQVLIIQGLPGIGKSALVQKYIEALHPPEGKILFVDVMQLKSVLNETIADVNLNQLLSLESIFVDNTEIALSDVSFFQKLLLPLQREKKHNKKIIFLIREEHSDDLRDLLKTLKISTIKIEIPKLTINEINECGIPDQSFEDPILNDILSIPFYLNLAIKIQPEIAELNNLKNSEIKQQLISLLISKKALNNRKYFNNISTKERKAILREIAYSKSQTNTSFVRLKETSNSSAVESLLKDNVLIVSDKTYDFSHTLYEDWTVNHIVDSLLECTIESNESPYFILEALARRLPHHKHTYSLYLYENLELKNYLKLKFSDEFDDSLDNLANLVLFAFGLKDEKIINNILSIIYDFLVIKPVNCMQIFKKIDFKNKYNIDFMQNTEIIKDILERLSNYEQTFSDAIDTICTLIDFETSAPKDRHLENDIQYLLDTLFYPSLGTISYNKRFLYLKDRIEKNKNVLALLPALYQCVKIYCHLEIEENLGVEVNTGGKNKVRYRFSSNPSLENDYCEKLFDLLVDAASSNDPDVQEDATFLLLDFVEINISNLLAEEFTQKAILNILNIPDFPVLEDIRTIIEDIHKRILLEGSSMLYCPENFDRFRTRINLFYESLPKSEDEDMQENFDTTRFDYQNLSNELLQSSNLQTAQLIFSEEGNLKRSKSAEPPSFHKEFLIEQEKKSRSFSYPPPSSIHSLVLKK